jgi:DNA-binding GntR family transcriptional regulator
MRTTLAIQAYDQIKRDIITCVYSPGQHIYQPQMVEKYKMGVTPIREALQQLTKESLLKAFPRFGYVVSPISISDVNQIFELRSILEAAAAKIAATVASQEDLEQLLNNSDFTYILGDRQSIVDYVNKNAKFHLSIAIATGNRRLVEAISKIYDELDRLFFLASNYREMTQEIQHEHNAIATAICNRDPLKAEQITIDEIAHSKERILEVLRNKWN